MQFLDLCFMSGIIALCLAGKHVCQPFDRLPLPVADLIRIIITPPHLPLS